jgi:Mg-chelatase subunit ChlD
MSDLISSLKKKRFIESKLLQQRKVNMQKTLYKLSDNLYLQSVVIEPKSAVSATKKANNNGVHHIVVIDCSGSMYNPMPDMRKDLKDKLVTLIGKNDTLTLLGFSGRNECYLILEAMPVATLKDLSKVYDAIDRWMRPMGLTGFLDPLRMVNSIISKIRAKDTNAVFSMFFMTDGQDNQWSKQEILNEMAKVAANLASATVVEYGYYTDRAFLAKMAAIAGGEHIFAEDFDSYAPVFQKSLSKNVSSTPKTEVKVDGSPIGDIVFTIDYTNQEVLAFEVENGKVSVPDDCGQIWYLSDIHKPSATRQTVQVHDVYLDKQRSDMDPDVMIALYSVLSLFSMRMMPEVVFPVLRNLADVRLVKMFTGCFGVQKYSEFATLAKKCCFDSNERYVDGKDFNAVPDDDAFTVIDLLQLLVQDNANRVLLDHPEFEYKKMSRAREDASDFLTEEEAEKIAELTAKMATLRKPSAIKEIQNQIDAITANKPKTLKFVADPAPTGYALTNLVFHKDRPNISIQVRKKGTVDLSQHIPDQLKGVVPERFETFIFRTYNVINNGIVHLNKLPLLVTEETLDQININGIFPQMTDVGNGMFEIVVDLRPIPVINRNMVSRVSAEKLFNLQYNLLQLQASAKIWDELNDQLNPQPSKNLSERYGDDAAAWLESVGIKDGGFNPVKTVSAPVSDVYNAKQLLVKFKGLSTLPKVSDVVKHMSSGNGGKKPTAGIELMMPAMQEYYDIQKGISPLKGDALAKFVQNKAQSVIKDKRDLMLQISKIKFAIVVGQTWFSDMKADQTGMDLTIHGKNLHAEVEMSEFEVKI